MTILFMELLNTSRVLLAMSSSIKVSARLMSLSFCVTSKSEMVEN